MPTETTDVVEIIEAQHRQVERLLTQVATATGEALEDRFCELRRLIAVHETAEEEVVYPVLRATGGEGPSVVGARTNEEAEGIKVLSKLESLGTTNVEFAPTFEEFRKAVVEHAQHEEAEVLPLLRARGRDDRHRMGKLFEIAEDSAPTHPHPHTGTGLTSHLVTGPVLSITDRVRDALRRD